MAWPRFWGTEVALRLSVLVPAYNESATIEACLRRVLAAPLPKGVVLAEVIVVDDSSTDGTPERVEAAGAGRSALLRLLRHAENRGKGAAVRTALAHATGDLCLIQDADLEYDPRDYVDLLQPLVDGHADAVYGSRFLGGPHRVLYFWHYVGNKILTLASNAITNLNLTDMECGYKAFRTEILRGLALESEGFGIEPEITSKLARTGARVYEVPVSYFGRTYAEGKKITWLDGIAALWQIVRFRFL